MPLTPPTRTHQPRGGHDPFAPHEIVVGNLAALDPSEGGEAVTPPVEAPTSGEADDAGLHLPGVEGTVTPEAAPVKPARRRPTRKRAARKGVDPALEAELQALGERE